MADAILITPTLHVEVRLSESALGAAEVHAAARKAVGEWIQSNYATVPIGKLDNYEGIEHADIIRAIAITDFTGSHEPTGYYTLTDCTLDVQTYVLRETKERRSVTQEGTGHGMSMVATMPNVRLNGEWDSLVYDDRMPSRLLQYLIRMIGMMGRQGLNLSTFNWNKICLLHGPPGSGKSTLCRALAQKLSIRLGDLFPKATLIEINANGLLSKYFGESGKLIDGTFEEVANIAKDHAKLVVVVIDEVETIAASRRHASNNGECSDGMRATNQLLTALDRLRSLPNILVCCTSNLIEAIDPAFLDRVDIKQHVPSPSAAAVYNILRSCLSELCRTALISAGQIKRSSSPARKKRRGTNSDDLPISTGDANEGISTLPSTLMSQDDTSFGQRIWLLAQKCEGLQFSGRTLRRLPVLGLAMYTWGDVGMGEAIGALEKAVREEILAMSK